MSMDSTVISLFVPYEDFGLGSHFAVLAENVSLLIIFFSMCCRHLLYTSISHDHIAFCFCDYYEKKNNDVSGFFFSFSRQCLDLWTCPERIR